LYYLENILLKGGADEKKAFSNWTFGISFWIVWMLVLAMFSKKTMPRCFMQRGIFIYKNKGG